MNKRGKCFLLFNSAAIWIIADVFVAGLAIASPHAAQQGAPLLQITSPSNNTVVTPGQTLSISIISPTNTSFTNVMVIGGAPMRASDVANSVPAQVSFAIPSDIELGKYTITATGTSSTGKVMYSGPIDLDVERLDLPTRLASDRRKIVFTSRGQRSGLRFHATFADGAYLDATLSSNLTLTSSDTSVATVDKNADVTAVGKGSATTATYTVGTQSITASVPVTVPPPLATSTPTALDFGNQNVGTSNSSGAKAD